MIFFCHPLVSRSLGTTLLKPAWWASRGAGEGREEKKGISPVWKEIFFFFHLVLLPKLERQFQFFFHRLTQAFIIFIGEYTNINETFKVSNSSSQKDNFSLKIIPVWIYAQVEKTDYSSSWQVLQFLRRFENMTQRQSQIHLVLVDDVQGFSSSEGQVLVQKKKQCASYWQVTGWQFN